MLERDHANLKTLFAALIKTTTRAARTRQRLVEEIVLEMEVHSRLEEEIFYPAFREATAETEDRDQLFEALEEHRLIDAAMRHLKATAPDAAAFTGCAKAFEDLFEHHAKEEEDDLFPRARKLLGRKELIALGERMQARKDALFAASMA